MSTSNIHSKFLRKWKNIRNDMRGLLRMNEHLFLHARGSRILIYHGICQSDHTRFNSIFLRYKTFEKHLQFLKKYFHVISLNDFYNQRFSEERFNICISFDDGFANNYKYVLPLMNKYQVPVTFFITGIRHAGYDILWNDFLALAGKYGPAEFQWDNDLFLKDNHSRYVSKISGRFLKDLLREDGFDKKAALINFPEPILSFKNKMLEEDYWLQMTEEEIKNLSASPLATIGCHGYYHNDLSQIPISDAKNEITCCKRWLENITGKEVDAIAFPYGAYSPDVIAEAKFAGFKQLLAVDFLCTENHADPTMRERLTINPYISVNNQMIATVKGNYE